MLRNVGLVAELRASRARVIAAGDEARRRIERDLHDGAQAQIFALSLKLRLLSSMLDKNIDKARTLANELTTDAGDALRNLRDLARGIYPPLLADRGLVHALTAQAEKMPVPTTVEGVDVGRYDQNVEAAVYFCCLEALQNITKYAEASSAVVSLRGGDGRIQVRVQDDGRGFDPARAEGSGVQNMADRLASLGGSLDVVSAPGAGCTVTGWVPVESPAALEGEDPVPSAGGTGTGAPLGGSDGGSGLRIDGSGRDGDHGGEPTGTSARLPGRFASVGSRATRRGED